MTAINHDRPVLKLIDDQKRKKSAQGGQSPRSSSKTNQQDDHKHKIHIEALACLDHLLKHGNINVVSKFLSQDKHSKQRPLLKEWFVKFGPVNFARDDTISFSRNRITSFNAAQEEPFWKLEPPRLQQPFNFVDELDKLIGKADRRRVRPIAGDEIDLDALTKAREILRGR